MIEKTDHGDGGEEDITANRHKGNEESTQAFRKAAGGIPTQRRQVLEACRRPGGVTCRALACEWGVGMNTISGRFSELKKGGLITKTGVEEGCGVYKAAEQHA